MRSVDSSLPPFFLFFLLLPQRVPGSPPSSLLPVGPPMLQIYNLLGPRPELYSVASTQRGRRQCQGQRHIQFKELQFRHPGFC